MKPEHVWKDWFLRLYSLISIDFGCAACLPMEPELEDAWRRGGRDAVRQLLLQQMDAELLSELEREVA